MRLAKAGYYGGDPQKIYEAPIDVIMDIARHEAFEVEYQETYMELNKQ